MIDNDVYAFLNKLQKSGVTNMFGAGSYIVSTFGVSRSEASKLLSYWMEHYDELQNINVTIQAPKNIYCVRRLKYSTALKSYQNDRVEKYDLTIEQANSLVQKLNAFTTTEYQYRSFEQFSTHCYVVRPA